MPASEHPSPKLSCQSRGHPGNPAPACWPITLRWTCSIPSNGPIPRRCDHWQTDADVLAWLKQVALWPGDDRAAPPKGLATAARALREAVRLIVARKADGKAGGKPDLAPLNDALAAGGGHLAVHPLPDGGVRIARIHAAGNAAQCLVPLAEAAADLLAHGDFGRVRQCESDECTLWFYDRTKSHRRRWCSMALCGNRHKVAAFRKREAAADEGAA